MNIQTYTLPAHWAVMLMYCDPSGMDDAEVESFDAWWTATFSQTQHAHCLGPTHSEAPEYFTQWHDARKFVLACDCLEYSFDVMEIDQ